MNEQDKPNEAREGERSSETVQQGFDRALLEQIIRALKENDDLHAKLRIALEWHL